MVKRTSKKSKFKAIAKIKSVFGINKLVTENKKFPLPGRCKYKNDDQGEIIEVFFKDYALENLPDSIASLYKLQKLSIRYTEDGLYERTTTPKQLIKLPNSFCDLKNLRH